MKVENRYQKLYNSSLYNELPLPIRICDDITGEYKNEEEETLENAL